MTKARREIVLRGGCLFLIVLLGCLLRLYGLGRLPAGLNQDEASEFYEAFCLLHGGADRNGVGNPVQFISWGSGQNVAYAWLCLPFFKLLGASATVGRLPMALVGCASILVFYGLARQWFGDRVSLLYAAAFAFAPWHIAKSRWALESNLFPDLILLGVFLISCYLQRRRPGWLLGAAAVFAFSLYSYGTAYLFVPLFLLPAGLFLLLHEKTPPRHALAACALLAVLALPIFLFVLINRFGWPAIQTPFFTIPLLYVNRSNSIFSLFAGGSAAATLRGNAAAVWHCLLGAGDGLAANSTPGFTVFYPWLLPFTALGFLAGLLRPARQEYLLHFWALAAAITALFVKFNVNRANILWIPIIYYTARGLAVLPKWSKALGGGALAVGLVLFCRSYFSPAYQAQLGQAFFYGYEDCLKAAEAAATGDIYVTDSIEQPYISYLFWDKVPPKTYREQAVKEDAYSAFEKVVQIGRYHFTLPKDGTQLASGSALIVTPDEAQALAGQNGTRQDFGNYVLLLTP